MALTKISTNILADNAVTTPKINALSVTNPKLAASAGIVNIVTASTTGYTVTNNSTWLDLGSSSLTITPTKAGNRIFVSAQYVYPKETSNFMNTNYYRLVYGSNIVAQCAESFCYSDPYTHHNMTGQGFAEHIFTVAAGEVGVPQKVSIQWNSGNGQFAVGVYLGSDPAVKLTAWEVA